MLQRYITALCIGSLILTACKSSKTTTYEEENDFPDEIVMQLGDVNVIAPADGDTWEDFYYEEVEKAPLYKGTRKRTADLIHTELHISFDWQDKRAFGRATLTLTAYNRPVDTLFIDAVAMKIETVELLGNAGAKPANYRYDGRVLSVVPDSALRKGSELKLKITYIAQPEEVTGEGGNAIRDEKGLYFINADGKERNKARQIWTQGEVQSTSCWLPTIDDPNEKMTHDIHITVHDTLTTVSNGRLVSSKAIADTSLRTDHWRMDQPHAPYLVAMVIGQFHIEKDSWRGIPLGYYVDGRYAGSARTLFQNTPEMLEFYSTLLKYPYPWPKYDQAVVYDYVSGAMENTTLSIFGGMLRLDSRELLDEDYEDVIAHELFHQWFGNVVTCESWAQLPLNESFATYGEYLWREHKYGLESADEHLYDDLNQYLSEALGKQVNMIRFDYEKPLDMFDGHSYQKGGLILHMLRNYLGDEVFFDGLNRYLRSHEFGTAEIHDFRQAMEEVSGEDLNWFFDQWFFNPGHPKLYVDHITAQELDTSPPAEPRSSYTYNLSIRQYSSAETGLVYRLPAEVRVVFPNRTEIIRVEIDEAEEIFSWEFSEEPLWVGFDARGVLLAEMEEFRSDEDWLNQLKYANTYRHRLQALEMLKESYETDLVFEAVAIGLTDPHYRIRNLSMDILRDLSPEQQREFTPILLDNALKHPKAATRATAFSLLAQNPSVDFLAAVKAGMNDSSYRVNNAALMLWYEIEPEEAVRVSETLAYSEADQLKYGALSLLAKQQSDYTRIFQDLWLTADGEHFYLVALLSLYLRNNQDPEVAFKMLDMINSFEPVEEFDYFTILMIAQINSTVKSNWSLRLEELQAEQLRTPTPERAARILQIERLLSIVLELH